MLIGNFHFISNELTVCIHSPVFLSVFCLNESTLYLNMLTLSCYIFANFSCKFFSKFVTYLLILCISYF